MDSRIPSFRARKKMRLSMNESTLRDVTNKNLDNGGRFGFKKKLSFGDEKMMEEIKRRERKVLRDINHLRSAIEEIEKETARIRDVEMPHLVYDYNTRQSALNLVALEIGSLDEQLESKVVECGNERRDQKQISDNLLMRYDIELTNEETKWDRQVSDKKHDWDGKLFELMHSKPDPDHVLQIQSLKQELAECETQWKAIDQDNNLRCGNKINELANEFNQYKSDKQQVLGTLKSKEKELLLTLEQTKMKRDLTERDSQSNQDKIGELKKEVVDITNAINKLDKECIPLKSEHRLAVDQYREIKTDCDHVNQVCENLKLEHNQVYDRYLQEKRIKKRLQFAIEDMQGCVRNFAVLKSRDNFLIDSCTSSSSSFHTLFCKLNNRRYQFSRILDLDYLQRNTLFGEEFETYMDALLRKQQDFSFFLCNPARIPINFTDTIDQFLAESSSMAMYHVERRDTRFSFKSRTDGSITTLHVVELTDDIENELHRNALLRSTVPCLLHLFDSSSSSMFMYLDLSQRLLKERRRIN